MPQWGWDGGVRLVTTTAANDNNNNATSQYNIDVQNAADGAQTTPRGNRKKCRSDDDDDDGRGQIYIRGGCPKKSSLESTIEIEERTAILLNFQGENLFA
jgi:hypothetical protein